jgi:alpha-tubulin suppressor-like RCC1 family protein
MHGSKCRQRPGAALGFAAIVAVTLAIAAPAAAASPGESSSAPLAGPALTASSSVLAWGGNESGELGDGTSGLESYSDLPVPVSGLSGVASVSAGESHNLALLGNGKVMAWGDDGSGQLGDGVEGGSSDVPVLVSGLSGLSRVTALVAGGGSLALFSSPREPGDFPGSVLDWGLTGEDERSDVPVPVGGLREVTAIAAGGDDGLALLSNDTVMAWGANYRRAAG